MLEEDVSSMEKALQATSRPNLKALEQMMDEDRFDEVVRGTRLGFFSSATDPPVVTECPLSRHMTMEAALARGGLAGNRKIAGSIPVSSS